MKEELTEDLTPASLETLSIVSYLGPISRTRIEYLRGVNSSVILRNLMIRGLIERFHDPEHASGFLYRLTFDAMKHFGIQQKEDLPDFPKFQELLKVFDAAERATTEDTSIRRTRLALAADRIRNSNGMNPRNYSGKIMFAGAMVVVALISRVIYPDLYSVATGNSGGSDITGSRVPQFVLPALSLNDGFGWRP